jgi:hypothetical protein
MRPANTCGHPHERESGRLAIDYAAGGYSAWMVCDDCGVPVRHLPRQTAEANKQSKMGAPLTAPGASATLAMGGRDVVSASPVAR